MTREAASIPLGMVRSVRKTSTKQGHAKYAGLQLGTIHKYNLAIKRFLVWLKSAEKILLVSLDELDEAIGEYTNHLHPVSLSIFYFLELAPPISYFRRGETEIGQK